MKKKIKFALASYSTVTDDKVVRSKTITSNYFLQQASLYSKFNFENLKASVGAAHAFTDEDEVIIMNHSDHLKKEDKFKIKDHDRNLVLRTLKRSGIQERIAAISFSDKDDLTQRMFIDYVNGTAPPLEKQTVQELAATYCVVKWLKGTDIEVPVEEDVLFCIKREEMLQPFKILTTNFEGRKKELSMLSDYVDWRPKSSILASINIFFRDIINWHEKPPLMITGIGGVGKSTLVSKFILDQLNYQKDSKLPFIYFDFDKPGLSVSNPIELAIEGLRQLSILFPSSQKIFSEVRNQLQSEFLEKVQGSDIEFITLSRGSDRQVVYEKYTEIYRHEIESINRPILVVFDSFEELQYRASPSELDNIFNFIKEISNLIPRLRPVFVGRSEVNYTEVKFENLKLSAFDAASASAFLLSKGVVDSKLRETIYNTLGGHPLTLRMVSNLVKQNGVNSTAEIESLASLLDQSLIHEQLIKRNLEHIHNPLVQKIAIPGILVRRINSEVIKDVLAGPCGLPDISYEEAGEILKELKKESFLIVENEDSINFRPDLRIALYDLIMKNQKYNAMEIHDNAVNYYKDKQNPEDRAEYLYHRLMRGDNPSSIGKIYDDDVRPYIENSLIELPDDAYLYLASLMDIKASSDKVKNSGLQQWEEYQKSQIEDHLKNGDEKSLKRISEALHARPKRSFNSPLYYYEAKVFLRLADYKKAESVIDKAIAEVDSENRNQRLSLLLLKADLYEYQLDFAKAFSIISATYSDLYKLGTHAISNNNLIEVELIISALLAGSRLARRIGGRQHEIVFNTLFKSFEPFKEQIYDGLKRVTQSVNISIFFHFPYKIYVERIFKEKHNLDIIEYLAEVYSLFLNQEIFKAKLKSLKKDIKNSTDLEKYLEKKFHLNLKDISEPGTLEINLIDVVRFEEFSDIDSSLSRKYRGETLKYEEFSSSRELIATKGDIERNHNLYPRRFGELIGRDKDLKKIIECFSRFHLVVIDGYPGVGKTSLALETGYMYFGNNSGKIKSDKIFNHIVWVTAKDKPEQKRWFNDVLNKIAIVLGHTNLTQTTFNDDKKDQIIKLLKATPILLIIDNFETINDPRLEQWLQTIPEPSKVLITSQRDIPGYCKVRIKGFSDDEAMLFIKNIAEWEDLAVIKSASDDKILGLIKVTAGNPQALRMALGYISTGALSLTGVVEFLKTDNQNEDKESLSVNIEVVFEKLLSASWNAIGRMAQESLLCTPIFRGVSFIDKDALQATCGLAPDDFNKALNKLFEWKLLDRGLKENWIIIHSITREFARIKLKQNSEIETEARRRWVEYFVKFIKDTIVRKQPDIQYWNVVVHDEMEKIDDHWDTIHDLMKWASKENKELLLDLVLLLVHYMDSRFRNIERMRFAKQGKDIAKSLGYIYQEALLHLDALGWTYVEENKLDEAYKEIEKGIELAMEINAVTGGGSELIALGNAWAARVRIEQKQVDKAMHLIEMALKFKDDNKPWIQFRIFMAAGDIYLKKGKHMIALDYYLQAKTKLMKYGGEGHFYQINPRIGLAYLGLGDSYLGDAEQIFEEVRNIPKIEVGKLYGDYGLALIRFKEGNKELANKLLTEVKDQLYRKTTSYILLSMIEEFEKSLIDFQILERVQLQRNKFQKSLDGTQTDLYILKNSKNMFAIITNYGGRLVSLLVPDKKGELIDVIVGPDSIEQFELSSEPYFGATIGRYANRIANGKFSIDGKEYIVSKNERDTTTFHGGNKGFHNVVWDAQQINDCCLQLSYFSTDGEEGFPGNLNIKVTFTLTESNELQIDYVALSDKETIVNFTNHAFYNLNGQEGKTILNHKLQINADTYTPIDANLIPLGVIESVSETPFDFSTPTEIGKRIDEQHYQLDYANGYNHNFVLNQNNTTDLRLAARVIGEKSKIQMEIHTQEPCLLFYSGNFMENKNHLKTGKKDEFRTAFVLETHRYPDSPNQKNFPTSILEPGKLFKTTSVYKFNVKE